MLHKKNGVGWKQILKKNKIVLVFMGFLWLYAVFPGLFFPRAGSYLLHHNSGGGIANHDTDWVGPVLLVTWPPPQIRCKEKKGLEASRVNKKKFPRLEKGEKFRQMEGCLKEVQQTIL